MVKKRKRIIQEREAEERIAEQFKKARNKKELIHIGIIVSLTILYWIIFYDFEGWNANIPIEAIFFPIGAIAAFYSIANIVKQKQVQSWKRTNCEILFTEVETVQVRFSTSYHPTIYFKYTFGGKEYISDKLHFDAIGSNKFDKALQKTLRYKKNEKRSCYVNTKRPEEAVLYREMAFKKASILGCIGITFFMLPSLLQ